MLGVWFSSLQTPQKFFCFGPFTTHLSRSKSYASDDSCKVMISDTESPLSNEDFIICIAEINWLESFASAFAEKKKVGLLVMFSNVPPIGTPF